MFWSWTLIWHIIISFFQGFKKNVLELIKPGTASSNRKYELLQAQTFSLGFNILQGYVSLTFICDML